MKKLILLCFCLSAGQTFAQGQTKILTLRAVKKGEAPQAVMDAIKQNFPKAIVGDLSILPAKLYGEFWSVDFQDNSRGTAPGFYLVKLKDLKEHFKAVYDQDGKLLSSKTVILEAQLPKKVIATITNKYPGWAIINKLEKITSEESSSVKEVYHVEVQRGKLYKTLFLDKKGNLIKVGLIE